MTNNELLDFLKTDIARYESEPRYRHSLSVNEESRYFASRMGISEEETFSLQKASLLHDIAKDIGKDKKLELCRKYSVEYSDSPVLHQDIGPYFARELYGNEVVDDAVFSAISKHTTGGREMNICDKILFVADYTEPTRTHEICILARERIHRRMDENKSGGRDVLERILDEEVLRISEENIRHVEGKGWQADPRTAQTCEMMRKTLEG